MAVKITEAQVDNYFLQIAAINEKTFAISFAPVACMGKKQRTF
jgi:hypothetical protein